MEDQEPRNDVGHEQWLWAKRLHRGQEDFHTNPTDDERMSH